MQKRFSKFIFYIHLVFKRCSMPSPNSPYYQLSDLDLFNLFKHNDVEAFEVVYNRLRPELIDSAFRKLKSRQKAEDIVQELFVSLYRKRSILDISVSPRAYLSKALKFKVLNEFRSETVRTNYIKSFFFGPSCKIDLANEFEAKELQQHIEGTISQLPEKCRQVFYLSRDHNMSNKEIAMYLDISVSTVEKHIGKALKVLRNNIKELEPAY